MADPNHDRPVHIETDDARGGETLGTMRYVLGASIVLVVIAFIAIWYFH